MPTNPSRPVNKRAGKLQISATIIGAVFIVSLMLYGLNHQGNENGGSKSVAAIQVNPQPAPDQQTQRAPPGQQNAQRQGQRQQQQGQQQQGNAQPSGGQPSASSSSGAQPSGPSSSSSTVGQGGSDRNGSAVTDTSNPPPANAAPNQTGKQ